MGISVGLHTLHIRSDYGNWGAGYHYPAVVGAEIAEQIGEQVRKHVARKTGVNTRDGKNLIGAIHYPSLVIDDVDVLKTLPRREFNQGFAEIIKHAIIADAKMFRMLQGWRATEAVALQQLIKRNIKIK